MSDPQEVLNTFDRQEVSWLASTVRRARQVKTIAQNMKLHIANAQNHADDRNGREMARIELKTALEFEQILEMIADEDIRAGEEQLKNN